MKKRLSFPKGLRNGAALASARRRATPAALRIGALFLAIGAAAAPPAHSADLFASGDQARQLCADSEEWCAGFVTGALDGWAALEAYFEGEKFCLPADLPVGRIVETFRRELDARPQPIDSPAAYILYEGLIALHPCNPAPGEPAPLEGPIRP